MVRALLRFPNSGFSISILFKGLWSTKIFLAGEAQDEKCHCPAQHPHPRRLLGVLEERRLFALLERERVRDLLPGQCAGRGSPSGGMRALCLLTEIWCFDSNSSIFSPCQLTYNLAGQSKEKSKWDVLEPHQVPLSWTCMFFYPRMHCSSIILAFSHYNTRHW